MKCERCGGQDELAGWHIDKLYPLNSSYGKCFHDHESDCIDVLKEKLVGQATTKPERFALVRKWAKEYPDDSNLTPIISELRNLIVAFDEANVLLGNYIYPEFIDWRDKWS
jgi:hypothetical protein